MLPVKYPTGLSSCAKAQGMQQAIMATHSSRANSLETDFMKINSFSISGILCDCLY